MENVYDTSDFLIGQIPPLDFQQSVYHLLWKAVFEDVGRHSSNNGKGRYILRYHGSCCNNSPVANGDTVQY